MNQPHTHLEFDRIEQLRKELSEQGYEFRSVGPEAQGIDLLAVREGHTIAIIVRESGTLSSARRGLRPEIAEQYDEIRLVVAARRANTDIEVDGLDEALRSWLIDQGTPAVLDSLSSNTIVEDVADLEIASLRTNNDGTLMLSGHAIVEVQLNYGGRRDGEQWDDAYPFQFTVVFDPQTRNLVEVDTLEIDTSAFYE